MRFVVGALLLQLLSLSLWAQDFKAIDEKIQKRKWSEAISLIEIGLDEVRSAQVRMDADFEELQANEDRLFAIYIDIAEKFLVDKIKKPILGIPLGNYKGEGVEILLRVQEESSSDEIRFEAGEMLAEFHDKEEDLQQAVDAYHQLVDLYPHSNRYQNYLKRLIELELESYRGPEYDSSMLRRAQQLFEIYQRQFPQAAERDFSHIDVITYTNEEIAKSMLVTANWYKKTGDHVAYDFYVKRITARYPDTEVAKELASEESQ
jgi:hypothetical protein